MTRVEARIIADLITNTQIQEMLDNARNSIKDWTCVSNLNGGITKGASWNNIAKDFDVNVGCEIYRKVELIVEFHEFLPNTLKYNKLKAKKVKLYHEEPIFY